MTTPLLLITVDVEEDMPGWEITDPITVTNARGLPRLADLCAELGIRPTYLCSYPMVTQEESATVLRDLAQREGTEIGTHLHAWNTPPFEGVPGRDGDERKIAYYQFELGPEKFRKKMEKLHAAVTDVAGRAPTSFRAGRYGIDADTLAELLPLGYEVDTSITPLADHTADEGPDFRNAPQLPYRPSRADVAKKGDMPIVEIPVSIGLTRRVPGLLKRAYVHLPQVTRLRGILSRDFLRVVDFAWLYPVRFDFELMSRAANALVASGNPILNVFLHSSELVPGQSGRIRTEEDVERCFADLRSILKHCIDALGARPATLTEAGRELRGGLGLTG